MRLHGPRPSSRPARGEWIEMRWPDLSPRAPQSRPARGEWIEIPSCYSPETTVAGLAPRGASGLKLLRVPCHARGWSSRPARGEWIEIVSVCVASPPDQSRPARGEWIEIILMNHKSQTNDGLAPRGASGLKFHTWRICNTTVPSRPARGEWIEMACSSTVGSTLDVSPREGRVD